MTRREKELFAMAIREAYALTNLPRDIGMPVGMRMVARQLADRLTFEVTDGEIASAVAVNLAGKGELTATRKPGVPSRDELYKILKQRSIDIQSGLVEDEL